MDVEELGPTEAEVAASRAQAGPVRVRVGPVHTPSSTQQKPVLQQRVSSRIGLKAAHNHVKMHMPLLRRALRIAVLAAAVWYVVVSVETVVASVYMLGGNEIRELSPQEYNMELIANYTGTSSISDSRLVRQVLNGDTGAQRTDVIYLETEDSHSFSGCGNVDSFNAKIYGTTFLRYFFGQMKGQLAYNITDFADLSLVAPVVDCTFKGLVINDVSVARVFFLVRRSSDPSALLLLSTSITIQNYYVTAQYRRGPALFMSIGFISDMSSTLDYSFAIALNYPYEAVPTFVACQFMGLTDTGFWQLQDVPVNPYIASVREILTARHEGFYIDDPETQSNLKNWHWERFTDDPVREVSVWQWHGFSVLRDSWAWTHTIHAVLGFFIAFQLSVLLYITFRCFKKGEFWIGDAFSSISSALLYRGVLVLIANVLNGFYTWTEYALAISYPLADLPDDIYYRPELLHSDLLTFYLNVATIVSYVTKERVHPLLAGVGFVVAFLYRADQANTFSLFNSALVSFAERDYELGESLVNTALDSLSPFRLRTMHAVDMELRGPAIAAAIVNILSRLGVVMVFIVGRKITRCLVSRKAARSDPDRRRSSGDKPRRMSGGAHDKPQLTLFESATGAALQSRFGVIAEYENFVEANGRRYATADAVYGNGFVIANRKFLIAIDDLITIVLIKLTRLQFKSVFVYDIIDGDTTKQTARLVYLSTIEWAALAQIGISNLA